VSAVVITRRPASEGPFFNPSGCFQSMWDFEYPVRKLSVNPTNPSQHELLTVGTLLVRIGPA
jgi:hypothetical protein